MHYPSQLYTQMTPVDLSIVVVNWNSKDYLRSCLASIFANTSGLEYEIIVVDSASFDGCEEMLQQFYPHVRFIQSEENVGFARANNLGAKEARGHVLLFLNPDTEVHGGAIADLYCRISELERVGVIGCRLLNSDGSLQTSCVQPIPTIFNQVLDAELLQRWFPKIGFWTSARMFEGMVAAVPVEAVSGACMMMLRDVFDRVRGFSTDYFMYAEDVDLCWKTRAAGFANYYVPEAEIVHHGGGSTQRGRSKFADVMIPESVSRLLRKTRGNAYSRCYRLALSGSAIVRMVLLVLWFPADLIKHRTREWSVTFNKWLAVLRWGLGLENWVREYDQLRKLPTV
jgi:GT2 family glycosyltransferase